MDRRPNIIVIHTDQQRGDCLGISGRRRGLYTPNLDAMAQQGATFDNCYATCPVCIPQRLSLLTGQLPEHHGIFDNVAIPYIPFETTLPAEMSRGGYQTALVGRTMHTYPFTHPYGFEYYLPGDPSSEYKETKDPFFCYIRENTDKDEGGYYGNGSANNSRVSVPFHLPDHFHQTKWATNRALDFLDNRDDSRPFLLFVGYYAPHSPHNPPAEYYNRYIGREDLDEPYIAPWDIPPESNSSLIAPYVHLAGEELKAVRAGYYGNISFLDNQLGRILSKLTFIPNTYVIFTSDHGELLGDHYGMHKSRPYQGSVHIPFIISGPDIQANQRLEQPIGWHDIMPTILDIADLDIPDSVDGQSIVPLVTSGTTAKWKDYIHGECVHPNLQYYKGYQGQNTDENLMFELGSQYLTDGKMKYIWYTTSGREQLFCIEEDYGELVDLSTQPEYADTLILWRKRLVQCLAGRPEGYSDGKSLVAGRKPLRMSSEMQQLHNMRKSEGYSLAYERPAIIPDAKDYRNTLH